MVVHDFPRVTKANLKFYEIYIYITIFVEYFIEYLWKINSRGQDKYKN